MKISSVDLKKEIVYFNLIVTFTAITNTSILSVIKLDQLGKDFWQRYHV